MQKNALLYFIFAPFGIALLFAGLFLQNGFADNNFDLPTITPVPTLDRLAKPTLPAQPRQADYGSQVYWLNCSPCHGDRGQGLTDEFRQQYPPEDQNCWKSHCHGNVTYENGFTLPKVVPQLIGRGSLAKFSTAANLYGFIHQAMPFQRPGVLTNAEYYQLVAFLLRQNGLIDSNTEVNASNAASIIISSPTPIPTPQQVQVLQDSAVPAIWFIFIGLILFLFILIFILKKSRNKATI